MYLISGYDLNQASHSTPSLPWVRGFRRLSARSISCN